jgi:toxin HigB-1
MRWKFKNQSLIILYQKGKGIEKYGEAVFEAFLEVMSVIDAAQDIRDLYALKSLHFEKLQGKRGKRGERSLRLNKQWRLILTIEEEDEGTYLLIINIEDYH